MIGEMVQAKYAADCVDHASNTAPQSFPDFLQQFFQLKLGKSHARAHSQSIKQLNKLAAEVEHYYDKSARVRIFARAAGVLVCCEGGVCGCCVPDLLNSHIAAIHQKKLKRQAAAAAAAAAAEKETHNSGSGSDKKKNKKQQQSEDQQNGGGGGAADPSKKHEDGDHVHRDYKSKTLITTGRNIYRFRKGMCCFQKYLFLALTIKYIYTCSISYI